MPRPFLVCILYSFIRHMATRCCLCFCRGQRSGPNRRVHLPRHCQTQTLPLFPFAYHLGAARNFTSEPPEWLQVNPHRIWKSRGSRKDPLTFTPIGNTLPGMQLKVVLFAPSSTQPLPFPCPKSQLSKGQWLGLRFGCWFPCKHPLLRHPNPF